MFDFTHNTDGRLSLVRNVTIRFPDESAQTSYSRTGLEERSRGEGEWAKFLHEQRTQETVSYPHTKGYLSFPALEDLILDFSAWHLEENEKVNVRMKEDEAIFTIELMDDRLDLLSTALLLARV